MSVKLTCEEVIQLLSPYIDNMLDEEQMQAVSEHLKICDACWKEYDELYKITKLLEELPELELPESFDENLRAAIANEPLQGEAEQAVQNDNIVPLKSKKTYSWKKLSSIAAIFVIGIFTLIMYNNSGDLIDNAELEGQNADMLNSSASQETTTFESSDVFSSRKYASSSGIGETDDEAPAADTGNADNDNANSADNNAGAANDSNYDNAVSGEGNASRSGENENAKGTTTPEVTMLRFPLTGEQPQTTVETVELANTLSQYLLMLDDELAGKEYDILDSVQEGEDLWSFQIKVTVTDDEGKETIQDRTYIGQDGTLTWKKD